MPETMAGELKGTFTEEPKTILLRLGARARAKSWYLFIFQSFFI
jgi:hypothetical protein